MIYEYAYADGRWSWAAAPHRARSCSTGEGAAPRSATSAAGRCVRCATTPADTTTRLPRTKGGASMEYHLIGDRCNLFRIAEYAGAEQGDARKRSEVRFEYGTQPNDVNLDLFALLTEALHDPVLRPGCLMLMGWVGLPQRQPAVGRRARRRDRRLPLRERQRRGGPCASRSAAGRRVRRMPASSGSGTSNTTTSTASESAVPECKVPELRFCEVPGLVYSRRGRWSGCGRFPGLAVRRGRGCSAVRVRFSGLAVRRCAAVRRDLVIRRGRWPEPAAVGRGRPERALRLLTRCRGRGMRSGPGLGSGVSALRCGVSPAAFEEHCGQRGHADGGPLADVGVRIADRGGVGLARVDQVDGDVGAHVAHQGGRGVDRATCRPR